MGLRDRLTRIEVGMPPPCCPGCVSWPRSRVVSLNDWQDEPREPTTPERCPRCGYEPIEIRVEYVAWPPNAAARKEEQP